MMTRCVNVPWMASMIVLSLSLSLAAGAAAAADEPWPVAGQQGVVRLVIVPQALEKDTEAYARQVARLCEPERTCFLNFYTNSTGAALAVPLPDAIANEATATFRRSAKQGAERFLWSCRLKLAQDVCF
jgi:hypothetical protein